MDWLLLKIKSSAPVRYCFRNRRKCSKLLVVKLERKYVGARPNS